ncbi:retrovirus-related pol polyprotein from transposon TNT 1-94 [Tanacetum coccineum]
MSTPVNTSSTDSQMHNNIMAAGSKDRPPMLGPGRYSQWRSRFLRYLDTKSNGEYLRKCIFEGPYLPTNVLIAAVEAAENILPVAAHEEAETIHNMTAENRLYFQAEKEAIFLILTGIGDEIYSTVDACNTSKEMWTAIERLQQGESLNVQDVKTNLFWEFGKFTSRDGESMESYYSRFYKLMNELTRNNLQVSPMQVNVQFLQQLQPEWSRFVTIVKQRQAIDTVSYHQLFGPFEAVSTRYNYYQAPKPQRSNAPSYKQSSSTRPSASTRHKGKEIAKPVTPQSESVSEEDSDPEQARRDKDMQKNLALLAKYFKKLYKPTNNNLRTSSNSKNKTEDTTPRYNNDNQSRQFGNQRTMTVAGARETVGSPVVQQNGIQCFNCKGFGHYARECRKPKRVKDYAYHKEKMMMCKQAEQGVPLQAEQADWLEDTDEEIDEQELEAHYSYMAKIQEVSPEESSSTGQPLEQVQNHDENDVFANVRRHSEQPESINDTYVLEKDDSNVIPDSSNICTNDNQVDQNAAECVDERVALANLIANLTLDTEENKTILKQLKKANASLTQELKECKTNLDESSRALGEATSSRDSSLIALQTKQTELEKYTALNDLTSDYKILQTKLNETLGLLARKDIDIKEGLKTKTYEISVVNQKHDELVKKSLLTRSQFEGQLKEKTKVISDLKVKEGKDIDTMIEMDKQIKFLNEILYKRNQSIQTIHMLAPKCATYHGRSTFANPKYLKKAQSDKPRLYEIPYDTSDPANRFCPNGEETVTLEKESRSKLDKDTVKPYNYTYQNSLYETFKPPSKAYLDQLERAKEVRKTMWRKTFVRTKPNIAKNVGFLPMSKSISKSRLLYNEMTNNFNHFRTICQQTWSNHTSSAFPNPTAKSMEVLIKILLMPLSDKTILDSHCFIHELKKEMNDDLEYVNSLEKELDELESEKADFSNIYDLLLEECVSKDVTCSYLHSLSDLNANTELQCLYLHKVKECECLAQKLSKQTESVNKEVHNNLLKSFAKLEKHSISLELSLQHCKEQMKNNPVCKENASNVFRKEREQYHEIQDLKAQMQDKNMVINELKKLILVTKGKSVETQFDKPSVVRQPNAQRIPKPSVLGKPTPFSNSPEMRSFQTNKSVNKTNASDGLFKPVTQQNLPQKRNQAVRNTNVLKPGMFRIASTTTQTRTPQLPHASRNTNPHMSKSSGVIHSTSISRPQLKSYQVKEKVVPNISQVKFTKKEVEDHHRISSISKKTKSVTACNDSSNSRTSNANAECENVVPISASKPKRKANKSVATPHKKTVASDTTIQKSKSYYKELYENTNQEWKWWIAKRCPSSFTWTQKPLKTKKIWIPKIRKANESTSISPTIDIVSRITNIVQLILFIVDSGCTKHMTGNLKLLCNFVEKFLGTVRFGNDQFAPILGYGDLIQGNVTIKRVYYVEGLNHNLFSVGQFCDADLEVAFRKSTCFVRDLQGNDLLTGSRGSDLYTISLQETTSSTPICFMAKASPTQAWLWHRRLSHLNFDYITLLSKKEAKFADMDFVVSNASASINEKKVLQYFLTMIQRNLQAQVITVRTDRGTEFLNKTLHAYFKEEGIEHQTSTARTPEQNGVVERQNRTLVELLELFIPASKLPFSFGL